MFPLNRKLPRLSTVWFVVSLSLTLWLAFGRPSTQPESANASVNSTAIKARSLSEQPVSRVKPISEVQLGERAIGKNPLREQVDESVPEPNPATWRKLTLRLPKENGKWLTVELLRPLDWIEDKEAAVGEMIFLDLEEMGAIGDAEVVSIEPCPPIQPGKANIITGKFIHEVAQGDVIELRFTHQPEATRVTSNHPYWSIDRHDFIPAGELREGEQVESLTGPARVESITPSDYSGLVYNLEINGEHVYRVGSSGLLAHNACAVKLHKGAGDIANKGFHVSAGGVELRVTVLSNLLHFTSLTPSATTKQLKKAIISARNFLLNPANKQDVVNHLKHAKTVTENFIGNRNAPTTLEQLIPLISFFGG